MNWNELVEGCKEFFNQPITIIIGSILVVGVLALVVLSKTSFGKKNIKELKDNAKKVNEKCEVVKKIAIETQEETSKVVNEIKEIAEEKVNYCISQFQYFKNGVIEIIKEIPNKKVQDKLNELCEDFEEHEKELNEYFHDNYENYKNKLNDLEEQKNNELANLRNKIDKLEELVNKLTKVEESA